MGIVFAILFIVCFEITSIIALDEQLGITSHISAGWLCWVNRIILLIPAIWYCGVLYGLILWGLAIFNFIHGTVGWVLVLWRLFLKEEYQMYQTSELICSLVIPANIICLIFAIVSFFVVPYGNIKDTITSNILTILIVAIIGFALRVVVEKIAKSKFRAGE